MAARRKQVDRTVDLLDRWRQAGVGLVADVERDSRVELECSPRQATEKNVGDLGVNFSQADGFEEGSGRRWTVFAAGPVRQHGPSEALGHGPRSSIPVFGSFKGPNPFRLQPVILSGRRIEALSTEEPSRRLIPDDAESPQDIATEKVTLDPTEWQLTVITIDA